LISFARAVASPAPVLILDEATNAIDLETERLIQQTTQRMMDRLTTLVIAHRLRTIQRADRIIVMHSGQVREEGTHEQLLAAGGLHSTLQRLQISSTIDHVQLDADVQLQSQVVP